MNAPLTSLASNPQIKSVIKAAIVVDQLELFRLGVESVLRDIDVLVSGHSVRAVDGYRIASMEGTELVIVGKTADLKKKQPLIAAKKKNPQLKVMMLIDQVDLAGIAGFVSNGVDALLLRSAKAADLQDAIRRLERGERVVASALAVGTLGRVGPPNEAPADSVLSPKEQEVLAELATGATYKEIAASLIVTQATIKTHLIHIYSKLEVKNRNEAIARGIALGLLG